MAEVGPGECANGHEYGLLMDQSGLWAAPQQIAEMMRSPRIAAERKRDFAAAIDEMAQQNQ